MLADATSSYSRSDFEREVDVLRKFSGETHPHLVSLLVAFEKGSNYYLLFHWAYADLKHFWKTENPGSSLDRKTLTWLFEQLRGITDGLQRIHNYKERQSTLDSQAIYGRHGDIKPENLLLFKRRGIENDLGIIQLSDFGLTRFHDERSRSGIRPSNLVGCSPTYRPPEVDFKEGRVSRSYDIWSLGCVCLEFITWHLGGWALLQYYVQRRLQKDLHGYASDQFFEIVPVDDSENLGAQVKPEVTQVNG